MDDTQHTDGPSPSLFSNVILPSLPVVTVVTNPRSTRGQLLSKYDKYCTTSRPSEMTIRGPYSLPSELRLADTESGPIQATKRPSRPVSYQPFYDRERKKGKIGKNDARIEDEGPLSHCTTKRNNKKQCQCNILTGCFEYQKHLRTLYCDEIRNTNHNEGTKLLLTYMIRQLEPPRAKYQKLQRRLVLNLSVQCIWCRSDPNLLMENIGSINHRWNKNDCPNYVESEIYLNENTPWNYSYQVPLPPQADGSVRHPITICGKTFLNLYLISSARMDRLRGLKQASLCASPPIAKALVHSHKLSEEVKKGLTAILETEPRQSTHYAPQDEDNTRKYYYCGGLSRFYFWRKYLSTNSISVSDKDFIAQCERLHFFRTYHRTKRTRCKPDYINDLAGMELHPSVSYSTALKYWKQYDIKFETRSCDICERCFSLKSVADNPMSTEAQSTHAKKQLLEHQQLAQLAIMVRTLWKNSILIESGHRELLQIDFAANPRCPFMELGQAFYSRILGVSFFVITSALLKKTFIFMFDETMAKKGSDEVISCLALFIQKILPNSVSCLDVCCDGCAGQSWNNHLALFFEDLVEPGSALANNLGSKVIRVDLFRCVSGHTFMEPDTEGGRVQRRARSKLLERGHYGGFIHKMCTAPGDPDYVVSWKDIANSLPGIEVVEPNITDFHSWSSHLLPRQAGGVSELYNVPNALDCFRGPHSTNKSWLISNSHYLNFGYGEDTEGVIVKHHGVWFSRNSFDQQTPDEVSVRQSFGLDCEKWKLKRLETLLVKPKQKQTKLSVLPYDKQRDLHQLGRIMSRDIDRNDFLMIYPIPEKAKTEKEEEEFGERERVARSILRKAESKWSTSDYYNLLRWKMKTGASKFKTKAQRKAQWEVISDIDFRDIVTDEQWAPTALETSNLEYSRCPDESRINENEHVDEDENFEVDDVPFHDHNLTLDLERKSIRIKEMQSLFSEELEMMSDDDGRREFLDFFAQE